MTDQPVSPPRSSREETPKDSPVPLNVEAARELVPGWTMAEIVQVLNDCADEEDDRCFLNFYKAAPMLRSLASSLSGIAEMKRDAERLDWLERDVIGACAKPPRLFYLFGEPGYFHLQSHKADTLREVIDAARLASDSGTKRIP